MTQLVFNASTVDPNPGFDPIPAGVYIAQIVESDVKPTKNGGGQYVQFTLEILDGPCKGRKVWSRINVRNQSTEAERIGQAQLSQLQHALGVLQLQDTQQLHLRPLRIKVTVRKDEQYGDSNEVKGFEAIANAQPGFVAPPAANPAPPAPAAPVAPWAAGRR